MPNFFTSLVGAKPEVPTLPSLTLSNEQQKALAANLNALPQSEQIAANVNVFNQQQIDKMLENVIPNYKGIAGVIGQNIEDLSRGIVPKDVQQVEQQSDAARGIGGGFGEGQIQNLVARDLARTSLDLTLQGQQSAQSWMGQVASIYGPGEFNVASMFVTPAQMAQFDTEERNAQFQVQWMRNQIEAMPAPWAMDLKQFVYRAMSAYSGTPVQGNPYAGGGGLPSSGGVGGNAFRFNPWSGTNTGLDAGTSDTGMFGSPSGPEGGFSGSSGGAAFSGQELDAGAGFGAGFGGLA